MTSPAADASTPMGCTEPVARPIPQMTANGTSSPRTAHSAPATFARTTCRPSTRVIAKLVQVARSRSPVTLVAAIAVAASQTEEIQPRAEVAQGLVQIERRQGGRPPVPPACAPLAE